MVCFVCLFNVVILSTLERVSVIVEDCNKAMERKKQKKKENTINNIQCIYLCDDCLCYVEHK